MLTVPWKAVVLGVNILSFFSAGSQLRANEDPHRPACTGLKCREARAFIKAHYCGESPFGNGPDDGCDIRERKKPSPKVVVAADIDCESDDATGRSICKQTGIVPPEIRTGLLQELHQAGLPTQHDKDVLFRVMKSASNGRFLLEADFDSPEGDELSICEVIAEADTPKQLHLLRKVPFQKTDSDLKTLTTWSIIDIAEVNGRQEFILEGDLYEDHWLESVEVHDGLVKTVFSGLGYYL